MFQGGAAHNERNFVFALLVQSSPEERREEHEDEKDEPGHRQPVLAELTPRIAPERALFLDRKRTGNRCQRAIGRCGPRCRGGIARRNGSHAAASRSKWQYRLWSMGAPRSSESADRGRRTSRRQ